MPQIIINAIVNTTTVGLVLDLLEREKRRMMRGAAVRDDDSRLVLTDVAAFLASIAEGVRFAFFDSQRAPVRTIEPERPLLIINADTPRQALDDLAEMLEEDAACALEALEHGEGDAHSLHDAQYANRLALRLRTAAIAPARKS